MSDDEIELWEKRANEQANEIDLYGAYERIHHATQDAGERAMQWHNETHYRGLGLPNIPYDARFDTVEIGGSSVPENNTNTEPQTETDNEGSFGCIEVIICVVVIIFLLIFMAICIG